MSHVLLLAQKYFICAHILMNVKFKILIASFCKLGVACP